MKRRALAMLLAVMMIISLIPVTAHADEHCLHQNQTPTYVLHSDLPRYHRMFCGICGEEYDKGTHQYVGGNCLQCGVKDPNCQHTTETTVGHSIKCADCGKVLRTTPCNYVNGACEICGKIWQEAVGGSGSVGSTPSTPSQPSRPNYGCYHNNTTYYANASQHWAICDDCGVTVESRQNHAFNNSGVCVICSFRTDASVDPEVCAHDRDAYRYIDDNTCQRYCATCGEVYESANHFVGGRAVDLENGKHELVCVDCEHVFGVKEYHTFVDGVCYCGAEAEEGCGCGDTNRYYYVKSGGGHDVYCMDCGDQIRLEQHVEGKRNIWNGDKYYHNVYCALCEGVMNIEEHDFHNENSTCACGMVCGADGSPKQHNPVGECYSDDNGHYQLCEYCDAKIYTELGPVQQHNAAYGKYSTHHARKCAVCEKYADIPHTAVVGDPYDVATHYMVCGECGLALSMANHDFKKNGNSTCDCGLVCGGEGSARQHVAGKDCIVNADGTHTPVCKYCGAQMEMDMGDPKEKIPADNEKHIRYCRACKTDVEFAHTPVYDEIGRDGNVHTMSCSVCKQKGLPVENHKWDEAGKCTVCEFECSHPDAHKGEIIKDASGHKRSCNLCGLEYLNGTHVWDGNTGVCKICAYKCEHNETKVVRTSSTATHEIRCKECNKWMKDETHDVSSGKCVCEQECLHVLTEYKQTATGHTLMCATCKTLLEEKESDHNFTNGVCGCGYECVHEDYKEVCDTVNADAGKHVVRCENCNKGLEQEAHTWNAKTGKCKKCSAPCGHSYKWECDDQKHNKVCNICGFVDETGDHTYVNGECSRCKYASCDHSKYGVTYGAASTFHNKRCANCKKLLATESHDFMNAQHKCVCGEVCEHENAYFQEGSSKHKLACDACGASATVKCTYDAVEKNSSTHDWKCICGRISSTEKHNYGSDKTCNDCGYTKP